MGSGEVVGILFVVVAVILLVLEWMSRERQARAGRPELQPQEVRRPRGER